VRPEVLLGLKDRRGCDGPMATTVILSKVYADPRHVLGLPVAEPHVVSISPVCMVKTLIIPALAPGNHPLGHRRLH
jgi:hypothetical protein